MRRHWLRIAVLAVAGGETVLWLAILAAAWWSGSDPATRGLDRAFAAASTLLYMVLGAPALVLALAGRALPAAAGLAFALLALVAGTWIYAMIA